MSGAEPFRIAVSDEALADLGERLARTRWVDDLTDAGWEYGTSAEYLRELVAHWRTAYDWRRHERAMNALDHFRVDLDDVPVHFVHQRGHGPDPLPLVLTHGWPWTFWDYHKVVLPLADPGAHGGDPGDAFDVVVPSLPGYAFSTPLRRRGVDVVETARLWRRLMTDVLGYGRFGAHGGDWGSLVSAQLGHAHADVVAGVHVTLVLPLDAFNRGLPREGYGPDEDGWAERTRAFGRTGSGYMQLQSTVPQSLAHGLNDSPAGLASWLVEKRRAWSDCDGEVERRFSKDDLLTSISLYWHTGSVGSAARLYYEQAHTRWTPVHEREPVVQAPTGIMVSPGDVILLPRRFAERYYNLKRWTVLDAGGHFAPMEEPRHLVDEVRAFFRPLR